MGIRINIRYGFVQIVVKRGAINDLRVYLYTARVQFFKLRLNIGYGRFLPARAEQLASQLAVRGVNAHIQRRKSYANYALELPVGNVSESNVIAEYKAVAVVVVFNPQRTAQFFARKLVHKAKHAVVTARAHGNIAV